MGILAGIVGVFAATLTSILVITFWVFAVTLISIAVALWIGYKKQSQLIINPLKKKKIGAIVFGVLGIIFLILAIVFTVAPLL